MFIGGFFNSALVPSLEAYNASLMKTVVTGLTTRQYAASADLNDKVIVAGGSTGTGITPVITLVEVYDNQLTKTVLDPLVTARSSMGVAVIGDHVLFAGTILNITNITTVETYDDNFVKTAVLDLSATATGRGVIGAANSENAFFVNGYSNINVVDIFDSTLTALTPTVFGKSNWYNGDGVSTSEFAFFVGNGMAQAFDENAMLVNLAKQAHINATCRGINIHENALFAGGHNGGSVAYQDVDLYDTSLVKHSLPDMYNTRSVTRLAKIDNYVIVTGATTTAANSYLVDTYYIAGDPGYEFAFTDNGSQLIEVDTILIKDSQGKIIPATSDGYYFLTDGDEYNFLASATDGIDYLASYTADENDRGSIKLLTATKNPIKMV
jgi:hypothetical protein